MSFLFESFSGWKKYCEEQSFSLIDVVLEYETAQKGSAEDEVMQGLQKAYKVMKDAVRTGL